METFGQILWRFCKKNVGLAAFLGVTLSAGTLGYSILGNGQYSFVDCLYMTVITITTIGYGEIVDLSHNPAGRIFTMFIAFSGIGIATYLFSNVTALMVEGRLKEIFWRKRMEKEIAKLRKHYIICSAEDVGFYVTNELHITKRPYVIVDTDKTKIERALKTFPELLFVEGDATDSDILLKAGIREAAGLFAVTGDDNQNLVISLTAKQILPGIKIVAKCNDLKNLDKIKKAGADAVVSPSFIGGLRIASEMIRPTAVSFIDVMLRDRDKNLRIEEVPVPSSFEGKPLRALNMHPFPSILLLAIKTNGDWVYNPPKDYILKRGNILVVMITTEDRLHLETIFEPLAPL
jgi:voltage-gated potassium channel